MTPKERLEASKCYERACQAIMHRHSPQLGYGWVEGSKYYPGKRSKARRGRQIDVTIHLPDEQLVLVECKQWNEELDVQNIEGFDAKVRLDIGLDGAMMVSCVGFTEAAINYAKDRNIGLITLNRAATRDEYVMKLDDQILVGFLEELGARDVAAFNVEAVFVNTSQISDEDSSLQSIPIQESPKP